MEVGCPGAGAADPKPNNIPKACPTHNPATSPARQTQLQPKQMSQSGNSNNKQQYNNSNKQGNGIKREESGRKTLKNFKN